MILNAVCCCRRFLELGGQLLEHTAFQQLSVYDDAAHLQLTAQHTAGTQQLMQAAAVTASTTGEAAAGAGGRQATFQTTTTANATGSSLVVSCGVVVDALGSFSPLSAQVRGAAAPEAAMLLVGSCVDAPQTTAAAAAEAGGKLSTTAAAADVLWGKSPIDRQVTLEVVEKDCGTDRRSGRLTAMLSDAFVGENKAREPYYWLFCRECLGQHQ